MSVTWAREYLRLRRNIDKLTDGQVSILDHDRDSDRLDTFRIAIRPNDGYYKGGTFVFRITLFEDQRPPDVYCETDVFHPNIDPISYVEEMDYVPESVEESSNLCLNLFQPDVWQASFGLESIVLGLLFLMHNPNFDEPFNPCFECIGRSESEGLIDKYMKGEEVNGHVYWFKAEDVDTGETAAASPVSASSTYVNHSQVETQHVEQCFEKLATTAETSDIPIGTEFACRTQCENNVQAKDEVGALDYRAEDIEYEVEDKHSNLDSHKGMVEEFKEDIVKDLGNSKSGISHKPDSINTTVENNPSHPGISVKEGNIDNIEHVDITTITNGKTSSDVVPRVHIDDQPKGDECHTRLVAFEDGYILFGGNDDETLKLSC